MPLRRSTPGPGSRRRGSPPPKAPDSLAPLLDLTDRLTSCASSREEPPPLPRAAPPGAPTSRAAPPFFWLLLLERVGDHRLAGHGEVPGGLAARELVREGAAGAHDARAHELLGSQPCEVARALPQQGLKRHLLKSACAELGPSLSCFLSHLLSSSRLYNMHQ